MALPVLFSDADALGIDTGDAGQQVIEATAGEGLQPVPCAIIHERRKEIHIKHAGLRGQDAAFLQKIG